MQWTWLRIVLFNTAEASVATVKQLEKYLPQNIHNIMADHAASAFNSSHCT